MKRFYTIIFAIMLLTGWVGCQSVDTEKSVTQTELIAMQNDYRVASYADVSECFLWLKDKDGNTREVSLKKDVVTSVEKSHGQLIITFRDGARATFYFVAYIDVTLSTNELSMAKCDSAAVTFTIRTEEPEKLKVEVLNANNVNAAVHLSEGKTEGAVSFTLKGLESFKEDVVIRFDNGQYKIEETISISRLNFGLADGSDKGTFHLVGEEEKLHINLLGEIPYTVQIEEGGDWAKATTGDNDCLELAFTVNEGFRRTAKVILTSETNETIELTIIQTMSQKTILTKFYEALNGSNWKENENWCVSDNIKDWYGVVMNDKGHVTGLYLSGNHLEGNLPDELFELVSLEDLILDSPKHHNTLDSEIIDDWNLIYGDLNELGSKIAKLTNLKQLDFNGLVNITCKDIPDEIWMPQMERIVLSQLPIKGRITPAIGNATNLRYLDISRNNRKTDLRGTIPAEITKLKKLKELFLEGNCHLTGPIPENIEDMESLEWLDLYDCALTGTVPESIFKLKNLFSLSINENFLKGEFELNKLSDLPYLRTCRISSNNNLQGIGEVPDFIERVNFDRDGYSYCYEYGVMTRKYPDYCWQHTDEILAERLAEE